MTIEMMPVHLTGDNDTSPAVGTTPPRRLQRQPKPDSQLTDLAAVQLLNSGRLTKRDLRVIQTVWMFSIMTTDQIQRLLFYNYNKVETAHAKTNQRLRLLYREYCLDRVFRGLGHDFIYQLDVQGSRLIQTPALRPQGVPAHVCNSVSNPAATSNGRRNQWVKNYFNWTIT